MLVIIIGLIIVIVIFLVAALVLGIQNRTALDDLEEEIETLTSSTAKLTQDIIAVLSQEDNLEDELEERLTKIEKELEKTIKFPQKGFKSMD